MEAQKKAAEAASTHHKYSKVSRIKATARALFLSGKKLTARELNEFTCSNDARKVISSLRRDGLNIVDFVYPDGHKLYWLATDSLQLDIFEKGGTE